MKRTLLRYFIFFLFTLIIKAAYANPSIRWKMLASGMAYTMVTPSFSTLTRSDLFTRLYAWKINLRQYHFNIVTSKSLQQTALYAAQAAKIKNTVLAINGGFFTPDLEPLGLRISNNKALSSLKRIRWWGIFMIKNNRAAITSPQNYRYSPEINFAIQAGPRLIIDGRIPKLRAGSAQRSALGVTPTGDIIIAITDNNLLLTATQLAILLKKLGCSNALNLDGGTSSQLFVHTNNFLLQIPSLRPVADLILVKIRS
ncbi:phosphodiester glycosidase family protein [Coxiella endosymbiont of Ornithodoros maritimus]|uniref:phosphodiester glycosidase family protein n=1 Tax=Coxiella endosymbiont of Ornithodoros maritimus TaxID=1656172 RepID=UPI002264F6E4|nr:phosphodiester glycosidase family protein [Coxiella endosymbiont of Ornithodoros maritimus]